MSDDSAKSAVASRIRALLSKTVAAGCSESEAAAAFAKAHELLHKYQLSLSDLELRAEGTAESNVRGGEAYSLGNRLAVRIAAFCDCKVYGTNLEANGFRGESRIVYFGLRSDCEMAEWLTLALVGFAQAKALDFVLETGSSDRDSFITGVIDRLNARLLEEIQKNKASASAGEGRALIVLKNQLVEEEWAKKNLRLRQQQFRPFARADAAYAAGRAAGDEASLNRPVGSNRKMIEAKA